MTDEVPHEIELGSITLSEKIGAGGFGQVFRGRQHPFECDFAIKLLDPHPFNAPGSEAIKRFHKEANILLSLRHENITPIYGVGEHGGRPYIVMEFFSGMDLNKAREFGAPHPEKVLPFMEKVTSALDYAHRNGILHRDIKPSNLLTRQCDARVVDFGIAQALDPEGERLTRVGATPVGGDAYAAPELIAKPRLLDPRCDIFSLGACWFWLLTGMSPKGMSFEHALRQVDGMKPLYESVVLKTLNQPEGRYQSMAELLSDIRTLRSGESPKAIEGELDDDAVTVLAVIFEQCSPHSKGFSTYQLDQRLSKVMNKFTLTFATRLLIECNFVEPVQLTDERDGYDYDALLITDAGQTWVRRNRARVESRLPEAQPKPTDEFDDDIPF